MCAVGRRAGRLRLRPGPPPQPAAGRPHHAARPRARRARPAERVDGRGPSRRPTTSCCWCTRRSTSRPSRRPAPTRATPTWPAASAPRTTPAFAGMHEAAALVAGATLAAARAVWTGEAEHAVNVAGGLHHAMPGAAQRVLRLQRPGDRDRLAARRRAPSGSPTSTSTCTTATASSAPSGTTRGCSPSRCTRAAATSSPAPASPRTPAAPARRATRSTWRCRPAPPTRPWLRAFHAVVPPLLAEFQPAGAGHPAGLRQPRARPAGPPGPDRRRASARRTPRCTTLAHRHAGGRWLATGGGGYELAEVVPRAWTHLLAEAAGAPIAPETAVPEGWREYVVERYGLAAPVHG